MRDDASDANARGPRHGVDKGRERRTGFDLHSAGGDYDVNDLGGVFVPRREMPGAELSVDMSVLSGLRATYESTMDGLAPSADAGITDAGAANTGAANIDAVGADAADARAMDARAMDADAISAGTVDVSAVDVSAVDASAVDASAVDAGAVDVSITGTGAVEPPGTGDPPGTTEQPALDMSRPIVHLLLLAKYGRLSGRVILEALDAEGFRPGAMQIYYWRSDPDPSVAFGIANLVEPGALDPDSLPDTETPGLVTFMCVPDDAAQAKVILDAMIAASRRLAHRLDAALRDETRSTLSVQAENHLREKVADIARRSRLKG